MRFGGWKFSELSKEDRAKIGLILPSDWKFEGVPGEDIWPIFKCPLCRSDCVRGFGGCDHICYIFDNEGNSYDYLNDEFLKLVAAKLQRDYSVKFDIADKNYFTNPPWRIAEVNGTGLHVQSLIPELEIVEFVLPCGDIEWKESAAFLKGLRPVL